MFAWIKRRLGITALEEQNKKLEKCHERMVARLAKLEKWSKDAVDIGVDVHCFQPHKIWIFSKLKGGQVREVEANFKNLAELAELVRELKHRYHTERVYFDAGPAEKRFLRSMTDA